MLFRRKKKERKSCVVVESIGACPIFSDDPKKNVIVIAYCVKNEENDEIFCFKINLAHHEFIQYEDVLKAIKQVENAKKVIFSDDKDIFLCKASTGRYNDVLRNDDYTRSSGFAPVFPSNHVFSLAEKMPDVPEKELFVCEICDRESKLERDSLDFAVLNAYNACLLGNFFNDPMFDLETIDHSKIRIEVQNSSNSNSDVLVVFPQIEPFSDDVVISYESDKFILIKKSREDENMERVICIGIVFDRESKKYDIRPGK